MIPTDTRGMRCGGIFIHMKLTLIVLEPRHQDTGYRGKEMRVFPEYMPNLTDNTRQRLIILKEFPSLLLITAHGVTHNCTEPAIGGPIPGFRADR